MSPSTTAHWTGMKLYHEGDIYRAYLERQAKDWRYARLLLDDGWRPISEYVYDRRYVYAAGVNEVHIYRLFIGRGGKYAHSEWWSPNQREIPVPLYVTHWMPLPEGVNPYTHGKDLLPPQPEKIVPPEPVYEPGPPTARLTPVPRNLLLAMRAGAVLCERAWQWTSWTLQRPGQAPEKITARGVDRLREFAFIERVGVRPPGELTRFHDWDWRVSNAGFAWLAAN
jgi:hypothetical protein